MKLAVFSDIHSNYLVFKKAYEETKKMSIDKYIFLGDYVTDGTDSNKVLDILKNIDGYIIKGNREDAILNYHNGQNQYWNDFIQWDNIVYGYNILTEENKQYINSLPYFQIIRIENKKIFLIHASPYNMTGLITEDSYDIFDKLIRDFDCDIYLFGHTHNSFITFYKNRYFINPGSIGLPCDDYPFKYGILTIEKNKIKYEIIKVNYSYQKLYDYYTKSEYYLKIPQWCKLVLMTMKDSGNHVQNYISYAKTKAKEKNIDISNSIPNDLFLQAFEEYFSDKSILYN